MSKKRRYTVVRPTTEDQAYGVYDDLIKIVWYLSEGVCNYKELLDSNEYDWSTITPEKVYDIRVKLYGEPIPTTCSYLKDTQYTENHPHDPLQVLYDLEEKIFKKPSYMKYMLNRFISYNAIDEDDEDYQPQYQIPPFRHCYR